MSASAPLPRARAVSRCAGRWAEFTWKWKNPYFFPILIKLLSFSLCPRSLQESRAPCRQEIPPGTLPNSLILGGGAGQQLHTHTQALEFWLSPQLQPAGSRNAVSQNAGVLVKHPPAPAPPSQDPDSHISSSTSLSLPLPHLLPSPPEKGKAIKVCVSSAAPPAPAILGISLELEHHPPATRTATESWKKWDPLGWEQTWNPELGHVQLDQLIQNLLQSRLGCFQGMMLSTAQDIPKGRLGLRGKCWIEDSLCRALWIMALVCTPGKMHFERKPSQIPQLCAFNISQNNPRTALALENFSSLGSQHHSPVPGLGFRD